MRTVIYLFAVLSVFSLSCRKDNNKGFLENQLEGKISQWLKTESERSTPGKRIKIESLGKNLIFSKLTVSRLNDADQLIVIPIDAAFKTINNRGKLCYNVLLVTTTNNGQIKNGNIVQLTDSEAGTGNIDANDLSAIFNNNEVNLTGKVRVLTITDRYLYELNYRNKRLYSFSKMSPKHSVSSSLTETECIDWFIVTTITYPDGTTFTTEEFIGRTCGSTGCIPVDPTVEIEDCEGSGNGGGGGEECCVPSNFQVTSNTTTQTQSPICGLEGIDPITGRPIKTCTLSWTFLTNHLLFYTWSYVSREQVNLEKEAGQWKIKSVQHAGMDMQGTIPFCVSSSCNITSSVPSINANRTGGQMQIYYTTSMNVHCCPWCSPNSNTDNNSVTFSVNSFQ